jgi:hypothetical protein
MGIVALRRGTRFWWVAALALGASAVPLGVSGFARGQVIPLATATCAKSKTHAQVGYVISTAAAFAVRRGTAKAKKAHAKTPLLKGDTLSTTSADGAAVQLCDGSTIYLHGSSQAKFRSGTAVVDAHGQVAIAVGNGTKHQLSTSTGHASGGNTLFDVAIHGQQSAFVDASGLVMVQDKRASNRTSKPLPRSPRRPPSQRR